MNGPVRTTVFFGAASALCAVPLALFQVPWLWPMLFQLFLGMNVISYSALLCRWSNTGLPALLFPALFTCLAVAWPNSHQDFLLIVLAMFSWIRSGICYQCAGFIAVIAEAMTLVGGIAFLLFRWPHSLLALPLSIWLFFLVQSLYFSLLPDEAHTTGPKSVDSFELATREVERLLENRERA